MKQALLILTMTGLFACKETKKKAPTKIEFTTVLYASNWDNNQFTTSVAIRTISDTIKIKDGVVTDLIDTVYRVPVMDTIRDASGKIQIDSIGKPKLAWNWYVLDKKILVKDFSVAPR